MDELKLTLTTKFMRSVLAKILSKMIKKKYGYKVGIYFNEINFDMKDGQTHFQANVEFDMDSLEFKKLLKEISEGES